MHDSREGRTSLRRMSMGFPCCRLMAVAIGRAVYGTPHKQSNFSSATLANISSDTWHHQSGLRQYAGHTARCSCPACYAERVCAILGNTFVHWLPTWCMRAGYEMIARRSTYSGLWMPLLSLKSPNLTACIAQSLNACQHAAARHGITCAAVTCTHLDFMETQTKLLNVLICDCHSTLSCRATVSEDFQVKYFGLHTYLIAPPVLRQGECVPSLSPSCGRVLLVCY